MGLQLSLTDAQTGTSNEGLVDGTVKLYITTSSRPGDLVGQIQAYRHARPDIIPVEYGGALVLRLIKTWVPGSGFSVGVAAAHLGTFTWPVCGKSIESGVSHANRRDVAKILARYIQPITP